MFEKLTPIIEKFQIKGVVKKALPIEVGHINHTYKILTQYQQETFAYVLQKINTQIFKEPVGLMENIEKVGIHLQQNNYPKDILFPIQSLDKQSFFKDNQNKYWRIFPFIENTETINEVETEEQAYAASFVFGEYTSSLANFNAQELNETIPDFHNTSLRYRQFFNSQKKASENRKKAASKSISDLFQYRYLLDPLKSMKLPIRVVHNDTKINNILFDTETGNAVCVIDLDTLMPGSLLYDYGDMVRTFTPPVDENNKDLDWVYVRKNILTALTKGYQDGLKDNLTSLEKSLLLYGAKLTIFEQALRFLTDYLNGNIYYKVEYEEQNLVRTKNQICLLESLVKE